MIDNKAIIDPSAKISSDVEIGPWTIIGPNVEIDSGTKIGPHVVIKQNTKIGKNNKIYQFSSIGDDPQHINYQGEETWVEIGDNNFIREYCSINRGTTEGGAITKVGDRNFLMAYVHIAHDCEVGNEVVFANNATLAGHVCVQDYVTFGGFCGVHQFCTIGAYSFVAPSAGVPKDVLPYTLVSGHSASAYGLNLVGLKRRGFTQEAIKTLRQAYNLVFRKGLTVKDALVQLKSLVADCPEVQLMIDILENSKRGIVR